MSAWTPRAISGSIEAMCAFFASQVDLGALHSAELGHGRPEACWKGISGSNASRMTLSARSAGRR